MLVKWPFSNSFVTWAPMDLPSMALCGGEEQGADGGGVLSQFLALSLSWDKV